jgi:hypothetical protein
MMNRLAGFASALVLMSGPALAAAQPTAHDFSQRMAALTEIQRYAALRSAVAESNLWCQRVMVAAYQGPHKNLDMWVARCGPKPLVDYGVFIGPDGTAQVSTCADLVKVKWPACRKLP